MYSLMECYERDKRDKRDERHVIEGDEKDKGDERQMRETKEMRPTKPLGLHHKPTGTRSTNNTTQLCKKMSRNCFPERLQFL